MLNVHIVPTIYIASGASGASGEQLVHTVLAQFPGTSVPVITVSHLRQRDQIERLVTEAAANNGTIIHTLVDSNLRELLIRLGTEHNVVTIDLMGDLLQRLVTMLGRQPAGKPGLYRQLRRDYFDRVAAIEFSMNHDDGQNIHDLMQAEIVLIGVSRVGKTPLSMYLAVLGWKVANVPIILGIQPPEQLFQVDPKRVIGLLINPDRLIIYRKMRLKKIGMHATTIYDDPSKIREEMDAAQLLFEKHQFSTVKVTNKPIESSANEIIELISQRFNEKARKSEDV